VENDEKNYFKEIMDDVEKHGDLAPVVVKAAIKGAGDAEIIRKILDLLKIKKIFSELEIEGILSEANDTMVLMKEHFLDKYDREHPNVSRINTRR
jgi:uncharacterized radical SAM superfamily Fe-S cluster-containing enzyme